jgi:glycosyltransferase involved in cell wall biosynthesis
MAAKYQALGMDNGYASRLTTIYNGIDLTRYCDNSSPKGRFKSKFHLADNVRLISFIGRFAGEKDPFLFVDIARDLLKSNPSVALKFVMAGDGYLATQIKGRIHEYGLEDHFILPGMLNNARELLADTHLFLLTSNHEGIPLTVMEALAMNVPVVSTIVGAVEEILTDGLNGYLIEPKEDMKEQFASKVSALINNDSLYQSLSKNTIKTLREDFSLPVMSRRYKEIFDELAGRRSN